MTVRSPAWQVPADVTAESLAARLREVGERTTQMLAEHDLDEVPPPSPRWDHTDGTPTLRWICFHVLHEYARHAGHLDIAVELGPTPIRLQSAKARDRRSNPLTNRCSTAVGRGRRRAGSRRRRRR